MGGRLKITRDFAALLPHVHALLESDIQAAYQGDPAARSIQEIRLCYPGITAMLHHRLAHQLYLLGAPLLARIIAELAHSATGIDIHPGAEIGDSFFIDHGTGVVIGETAIIGQRVRIYQAVTLGAKSFPVGRHGELVKGIPRHPIVEDDVVIYAGRDHPRPHHHWPRLDYWRQHLAHTQRAAGQQRHPGASAQRSVRQRRRDLNGRLEASLRAELSAVTKRESGKRRAAALGH